jgi:DNA-binding IclR family transcriptional regulator
MSELPPHEHALLTALAAEPAGMGFEEVVRAASLDQSLVAASAHALSERGWV